MMLYLIKENTSKKFGSAQTSFERQEEDTKLGGKRREFMSGKCWLWWI